MNNNEIPAINTIPLVLSSKFMWWTSKSIKTVPNKYYINYL